jgi:hypothetical protein
LLASAGYRVIIPYLRGYGTTRFLSIGTFGNGQQSVVAVDIIALMDALKIKNAVSVSCGYWWLTRRFARGKVCEDTCIAPISTDRIVGSKVATTIPEEMTSKNNDRSL